ncbi:hypothetical protein Glove_15g12 [Diversispora epigaea]|uniref:Protein kinase domain-containing protein n=1 Tax=Diversispora epigaea TaxID=1348612 RepID=A0A397JLZ8_9GLOM|nr:hypothetical protein Glove_15g12 [Diversispora epigaea]
MSQEKKNEKEWMNNLIIPFQKENIPFYRYSEFENVKLITKNVYKATFKASQKTVALKNLYLNDNDKFTPDNLIYENLAKKIKRHRKLEIHDENTNNYMMILEYVSKGSLRQYLKTDFQKMDWNANLNLAKQIANALMHLHSNDIIHGSFNSENILIHNGIVKLNVFGLIKINSDSLSFLTNNLGPIQYMDWDSSTRKREMAIPAIPHKYKEIYTDCWKHNGNSRPDISQVIKNLSEIIISDTSVEFETPQPYNAMDVELENLNIQNEEPEIKPNPPFVDFTTTEVNVFIHDLHEFLIYLFNRQCRTIRSIMIKNYIRERKKNPVKILYEMIRHPSYYWFTSLIGFFYQYGVGTVVDNQMAFKFFSLAVNQIIDTFSSNSSHLRKLYNNNKKIGIFSLAFMYLTGLGVEEDTKKAFRIYQELANKGFLTAVHNVAYCYEKGLGVKVNAEKAFETYLKSAEKGCPHSQIKVGDCYHYGTLITKDQVKGFQWFLKCALAGNINAMVSVGYGYGYENGIGVSKDKKEAFKWYLKAAEKEHDTAQHNLGCYYYYYRDYKNAFEWFKKAAENDDVYSQYNLGKFFYEGSGIKKDIVKAIFWLNKAKENANIDADRLLNEIIRNRMMQ